METLRIGLEPGSLISSAVAAGSLVFVSGHVGWDPDTREAPRGIEAQTAQTFENLQSALDLAGAGLESIIKLNVFLTHINEDFDVMNKVFRRYFPDNPPARTTVGVAALARPDLLIEVEAVALVPEAN